jgi:ZIP family zinc transporter
MSALQTIITLTLLSGLAIPFGAIIANQRFIKNVLLENEFQHFIVAFGGGALLSAVALVLVPEGSQHLSLFISGLCFSLGALLFMGLDILQARLKTSASQLLAMLADFVPESLALGATFTINPDMAVLLAVLIALQNIPEGFNAFGELKKSSSYSSIKIIVIFTLFALLGPVGGVSGYLWLVDSPQLLSGIMLFASGGILYMVFQDIAPQVPLQSHYFPPMGAVCGFLLGLLGYMMTI